MKKLSLLDKIFGKKGANEKLLIDGDQGVPITMEEAKRLTDQHEAELKKMEPMQKRLKEETALLKSVVEFKLSPGDRRKVRDMLASGEDPALIAAYLKAPFRIIAVIANDVLKEAYGNSPEAPQIPTDLPKYLEWATKTIKENEAKAAAGKA